MFVFQETFLVVPVIILSRTIKVSWGPTPKEVVVFKRIKKARNRFVETFAI
jgi:hypothetical protein